ncbi:hypothetical protein COV82_04800 [Candidatus Peregrinibacteria bacterium CG11_big_fil_rev_8_21_14_0_20_46_8]|nr:MAG: hypothetical protein COV82_04800 [Candidatus Peregrinibacteria bacterium CG11_big_fil_rev_8_21_14_0_20_46_8]
MPARTLKYIIVGVIAAAAVILLLFVYPRATVSNAQSVFPDVPDSHRNAFAIQKLKELGFISGYPDGTFQPDREVNRAEAVAIILKASGISAGNLPAELNFSDVHKEDWFYPMIRTGVALQKLKGYDDGTFRPQNPINLVEALTTTLSFYRVRTLNLDVEERIYTGLDREAWYAQRAQYAKNFNIIEPNDTGSVDPGALLTRGQLSEIIYRTHIVNKSNKPYDISRGWISSSNPGNFWKLNHPEGWNFFRGTMNSVLWKPAKNQAFFTRIFPTTAQVSISLIDNPADNTTANQYFAELKDTYNTAYGAENITYEQGTTNGYPSLRIRIPSQRMEDLVLRLPNAQYLVMYGQYGDSSLGDFLGKQISAILDSYEYVDQPEVIQLSLEERMERLRESILFESKADEILELFPDRRLIETDAIGIGTGPVDYYFSSEANHTIKVERNSKTILNIQAGETTKF